MTLPRTPSFSLTGKRALVTGAPCGIGEGSAVALAEAGAKVWLAARGTDKMLALQAEMAAVGLKAHVLAMDVADVAATENLVADHGPFDGLVNSARLARHAPAGATTLEDIMGGVVYLASNALAWVTGASLLIDGGWTAD